MKLEVSETPWSVNAEDDPDEDERRFKLFENVELEDDDFVVSKKSEDDGSFLIEKLNEDGHAGNIKDYEKKISREVYVHLRPELKEQLIPYFYEKPTNRTTTKYKAKELFENRHTNQVSRSASDTESFDFRGCRDVESKIEKVKRVREEKDFESFETLIEQAKDRFREELQKLVEEDNRKLREQIVRSYKDVNDPLEDFTEDSFPEIRDKINKIEEEISDITREIQEKVGHLKEKRGNLKSKIDELKDEMLQREIEYLRENDLVPDDEFAEELLEAMRKSSTNYPFA